MQIVEQASAAALVDGCEPLELFYAVSGARGFGHSSRAIAVTQALQPESAVTTFAVHENAHEFVTASLTASGHSVSLEDLHAEEGTTDEFIARNQGLLEGISASEVILNDFVLQVPAIRSLMDQCGAARPLIGVYHSIDGYQSEDPKIVAFQEECKRAVEGLDYLFLTEPKPEHADPYELERGTIVVPCDPIVRRPSLNPEQTKVELGLEPGEEFIYIQGGGVETSKELVSLVASLEGICLDGLKFVLAPFKGLPDGPASANTIRIKRRLDAHNIIAASAGVISKPGMGTTCEAIANRKPLLLVDHPTAEGRLRFTILQDILGQGLPFRLDAEKSPELQIKEWLEASQAITEKFDNIPCDGAVTVASMLRELREQPVLD